MDVKGKVVTVIGLGKSGGSAARLLCEKGAKVKISEKEDIKEIRDDFLKNLEIEWGRHTKGFVLRSDLIVKSPGVPRDIEVLIEARHAGIPIISEIELAYSYVANQKIIAITGTNGKTTVTHLIGEILKRDGKRVKVCGNIGLPFSEIIPGLKAQDLIVLEVSSFQLEDIIDFRPYISVFLNLTRDHLDRYSNMEEYRHAKIKIFKNQTTDDFAVLNVDDPEISGINKILPKIIPFSKHNLEKGVCVKSGKIFSNDRVVCGIGDLRIPGLHNLENVLASIAVNTILDVDFRVLRETISKFQGLEHRLEEVSEIHGIKFINDSKSTNISSLRMALDCTSAPIILIAGGKDKGFDYSELKDLMRKKVRLAVLFGEVRHKMACDLASAVSIEKVLDLREATTLAYEKAKKGDCILLSPGTSSFDQFRDFEERGRTFKELVAKIGMQ
ncbi:MAG: UDP-N-acetylmuramoyl-L-alanine--D-glutamate ligase [bacterium]|nr:UDP-N-acetylmuramoyl-L-alanine--D-glutamate ligase [bacterium]